jgi:O-antigen/teichoic acid export membrane protein
MLSTQVDQVLVVGLLNAESMGIYAVALSVSRLLFIVHTSVSTVLFPKASSLQIDAIVELTNRAARISTATSALAAISLIAVTPLVVPFCYGRAFLSAVPIAQVLTIEAVLAGATWVLAQAFMAAARPGVVAVLQALGLALCVPLMLWLIPLYGLLGAALALLGSTAVRFALVSLSYPALLRAPVPSLVIRRADLLHLRALCSAALRLSGEH